MAEVPSKHWNYSTNKCSITYPVIGILIDTAEKISTPSYFIILQKGTTEKPHFKFATAGIMLP
jgi:hypothetical protein